MKRRYVLLALLCLTALVPQWGCGGGGSSRPSVTLTGEQQAAINDVSASVRSLVGILGGALDDLELSDFSPQGGNEGPTGTCPAKSIGKNALGSVITLDYGSGCSHNGTTYAGTATVSYAFVTNQATLTFQNFTVDNKAVEGTVTLALSSLTSPFSLSGSMNLTVDGTTISGPFTVTVADNGVITIPTASLTVAQGTSYSVALANLVINPVGNSSGLPESGTAAISYAPAQGDQALVLRVTFTPETPSNRTVLVSVNGSDPIRFTLPE